MIDIDPFPAPPVSASGPDKGVGFKLATRAAFHAILDLQQERVFAYEALIRGSEGQGAAFVLGQVDAQQIYSFDQSCRVTAIREAVAAGIVGTGAKLSINFIANAVTSPRASVQRALDIARETGFPADRLMFEFSENEIVDSAHIRNIVDTYREMGFQTAIDDFGTGQSGLLRLAMLGTDMVKVDMDLIRGIDRDNRKRAVLECLVQLFRKLGTEAIVEGVETEEELAVLRLFGIRYVQGFLFGKPTIGALPGYPTRLARAGVAHRHRPGTARAAI